MVTYCIYAIVDPRNLKIFYVGHTSRLDLRKAQHLECCDTVSGLTIDEILAGGLEPVFVELEACEDQRRALAAEVFWIDLFRCRGVQLTNAQAFSGYVEREAEKRRLRVELGTGSRIEQMVALANGRPVRDGRRWSFKEDQMMRRMGREGMDKFEIADALSRSVGAIEERMALPPPKKRKKASEDRPGA